MSHYYYNYYRNKKRLTADQAETVAREPSEQGGKESPAEPASQPEDDQSS